MCVCVCVRERERERERDRERERERPYTYVNVLRITRGGGLGYAPYMDDVIRHVNKRDQRQVLALATSSLSPPLSSSSSSPSASSTITPVTKAAVGGQRFSILALFQTVLVFISNNSTFVCFFFFPFFKALFINVCR